MRDKGYENTPFVSVSFILQLLNQGLIPVRIYEEGESSRTTATAVKARLPQGVLSGEKLSLNMF